jgi:hypothetical protein
LGSFGSAWSLESISRVRGGKTFGVSPEMGGNTSSKPSFTFVEKGTAVAWTFSRWLNKPILTTTLPNKTNEESVSGTWIRFASFFVWFVVFVVNWFSFSFWLLAIPLGPFFAKIPESQSNGPATHPV